MPTLITKEMVLRAILLAKPSAIAILKHEGTTWGPQWVVGYVEAVGLEERVCFSFDGSEGDEEWNEVWGKPDEFAEIAHKKLDVSMREELNTSVVIAKRPGCLKEGEFLYSGGAYREGNGASASGAEGFADEAIAELILTTLNMLVQLKVKALIAAGQKKIL